MKGQVPPAPARPPPLPPTFSSALPSATLLLLLPLGRRVVPGGTGSVCSCPSPSCRSAWPGPRGGCTADGGRTGPPGGATADGGLTGPPGGAAALRRGAAAGGWASDAAVGGWASDVGARRDAALAGRAASTAAGAASASSSGSAGGAAPKKPHTSATLIPTGIAIVTAARCCCTKGTKVQSEGAAHTGGSTAYRLSNTERRPGEIHNDKRRRRTESELIKRTTRDVQYDSSGRNANVACLLNRGCVCVCVGGGWEYRTAAIGNAARGAYRRTLSGAQSMSTVQWGTRWALHLLEPLHARAGIQASEYDTLTVTRHSCKVHL